MAGACWPTTPDPRPTIVTATSARHVGRNGSRWMLLRRGQSARGGPSMAHPAPTTGEPRARHSRRGARMTGSATANRAGDMCVRYGPRRPVPEEGRFGASESRARMRPIRAANGRRPRARQTEVWLSETAEPLFVAWNALRRYRHLARASRRAWPSERGMWMPTISLIVGTMSAGVAGTANCPLVIPAPKKASGTRWS